MFGGDCFMVDDKMCVGTYKRGMKMCVEPKETAVLVKHKGAGQMIHGGKPMKGFLFVKPEG